MRTVCPHGKKGPRHAGYCKSNGHLKKGRYRNEKKKKEKIVFKKLCQQEGGVGNIQTAEAVREKFVGLFQSCPLKWQTDILPDV